MRRPSSRTVHRVALDVLAAVGGGGGRRARRCSLVVDDLQWADPTHMQLHRPIVARRPPGPHAAADGAHGPRSIWSETRAGHRRSTRCRIARPAALANDVAAGAPSTDRASTKLVERCDGVPLFVEELCAARWSPTHAAASADSTRARQPARPLLARLAAAGGDFALAAARGHDRRRRAARPAARGRRAGPRPSSSPACRRSTPPASSCAPGEEPRSASTTSCSPSSPTTRSSCPSAGSDTAATADALAASPPRSSVTAGALAHHLERAGRPARGDRLLVRAARGAQHKGAHAEALAGSITP